MAERNRKDTKVQGRVHPDVKADLNILAEKRGINLGAFVSRVLTSYRNSKKRKGLC